MSKATGIELEIIKDIESRQQLGIKKYGVTVENNPLTLKQWLQHAYEESLDNCVYLKRAMKELEDKQEKVMAKETYVLVKKEHLIGSGLAMELIKGIPHSNIKLSKRKVHKLVNKNQLAEPNKSLK